MNLNKQTAVNWLIDELTDNGIPHLDLAYEIIEKAKKMEKQKEQKYNEMIEMLKISRDKFLDLKHDNNLHELQEIQEELEQLIKEVTEL